MLGIVQGRLTFAGKKLQAFPKDPFKEFDIASKIGYDFIEFFSERNINKKNPIRSDKGIKKYIKITKLNKIKIYSFCDDYVINHSLTSLKTKNIILNTIEQLQKLNIKKYILPLYGKSLIKSKNKYKLYKNLSIIAKTCEKNKIELLLESNMTPKKFMEVKKNIISKNLFFLFDCGNRINLKSNFASDIELFGKNIKHVHLKDKNINKKNVLFGKGIVDFELLFLTLKKINYKGSFAIESQRGKNIKAQALKNYLFFNNLIKKYKIYSRNSSEKTILGYRHTGIICKDMKKSLYFYKNILGLKVIQEFWDDTDYINKISGLKNAKIHFIKLKMESGEVLELLRYPTHITKLPKLPIHNVGTLHIALQVKDIEKTYIILKKKGVKFISKPILSSEKFAKVCFCLDPNNIRVELVEII